MSIGSFFRKILSPLINLFRNIDKEKAIRTLNRIADLIDPALRAAEYVSRLTPNPADDLIIAALKRLNTTAQNILSESSEIARDGARLALAAEVLREQLIKTIQQKGKVQIADLVLTTAEEVLQLDKNILRSAVQDAYTVAKLGKA